MCPERRCDQPHTGTFRRAPVVKPLVTTVPASTTDQHEARESATSQSGELAALTVFDHCDNPDCPAQAFVRAKFKSGLELVFCGHHGHQLMSALAGSGAIVRDDTQQLTQQLTQDRSTGPLG